MVADPDDAPAPDPVPPPADRAAAPAPPITATADPDRAPDPVIAGAPARQARARRDARWPRRLLRLAVAAVAAPVIFALILPLLLLGQEVTAPSWLRARVEAQATAALGGGAIGFDAITVTVGRDLHPQVRLSGTVLRDAAGTTLARIARVDIGLSPRGLILQREVLAQHITLSGAQIALRRNRDGSVAVAFDLSAAPAGEAQSLAALPGTLDAVFDRPALAALERITASGLIVNYDDARSGRSWTLDGGQVALDLTGRRTRLTGSAELLSGRDYVTYVALDYDSPRDSPEARVAVDITDAAARDIATQSGGLSWLGALDARVSARIVAGVGADGGLAPFSAELDIGAGVLQPTAGARPLAFEHAAAALRFDPVAARITFDRVAVASDWGALAARGTALLRDTEGGLPRSLLGQFTLTDIRANPAGLYPEPLEFPSAFADFRLRLAPFEVELGAFGLMFDATAQGGRGPARLDGQARIAARPEGWDVSVDAAMDRIGRDRVMALWPMDWRPGTRRWFQNNLDGAEFSDVAGALRLVPDRAPLLWLQTEFADMTVRPMRALPPITAGAGRITLAQRRLTVALDAGGVQAPQGGALDLAGSVFTIPETGLRGPRARLDLRSDGSVTATLSLLDQPPFRFMTNAGLPVDLAEGRVTARAGIDLRLVERMPRTDLAFDVSASLHDLRSDRLIAGRRLTAPLLELRATDDSLSIGGPMRIGAVPVDAVWRRALGPGSAGSAVIEGQVELSQAFLDEFGIGLPPDSLRGRGRARFDMSFAATGPPAFALSSDLRGISLRVPALGWVLPADASGRLEVAGRLGPTPVVERLVLSGAGLLAEGAITLRTGGGGLDRARFARVRLGDWLDAPVTLVGRGPGRPVAVEIAGGRLDLARATFGAEGGGQGGGPLSIRLDRLQVAQGIALTGFSGNFTLDDGLSGRFTAAMNSGAAVEGVVAPVEGRVGLRLRSATAGEVIRDAGLLANARGGVLDLLLMPNGAPGSFDGTMSITGGLRVIEAPALAQLLNAISVVGLLQQMAGQGLVFDEVAAEFRLTPDRITVTGASAIGPGLGISLDGYYRPASREMDFQGVVSPFYLVNAIGSVLTRRGEGLIGFAFTLRGPVGAISVGVNPLSALTPGMFREIFRRPPPVLDQ